MTAPPPAGDCGERPGRGDAEARGAERGGEPGDPRFVPGGLGQRVEPADFAAPARFERGQHLERFERRPRGAHVERIGDRGGELGRRRLAGEQPAWP